MQTDHVLQTRGHLLNSRLGYDLIASCYEQWHWCEFWRMNEAPIVQRWLDGLKPGIGIDAGSGIGPYLSHIVSLGHICIAIDMSLRMLTNNKQKIANSISSSRIQYVQASVSRLPFATSVFDWVICTRVLSQIQDFASVLTEFDRILNNKGVCLISDVHPDHPYDNVVIPLGNSSVAIETYKHSISDVTAVLNTLNFQVISLNQYYLKDLLWQPPRHTFGKLYKVANAAIFYVCMLNKGG